MLRPSVSSAFASEFLSGFLLPLAAGGTLRVGRPLSLRDVRRMMEARAGWAADGDGTMARDLRSARGRALSPLVARLPALELDEPTWRLGAAVHDLLALSHPRIASGPGAESRVARVAEAAASLAALGAPTSLAATLARHSVVARLPEVVRLDHTVRYWLGRQTFVGRRPPARMLALPRLRGVSVETVRRTWLRDVGVKAVARPAFAALTEASPLGEALDPLRLDPPPSWGRMLSVLRFPVLARAVAGRWIEAGLARAGDALTEALYRFGSLHDVAGPVRASAESVGFALRFLAHVVWLAHMFHPGGEEAGGEHPQTRSAWSSVEPSAPKGSSRWPTSGLGETAGRELAVLLAAAARVQPSLIRPADVAPSSPVGQRFARHLERWFSRHEVERSPRWTAALELCQLVTPPATEWAEGATPATPTNAD